MPAIRYIGSIRLEPCVASFIEVIKELTDYFALQQTDRQIGIAVDANQEHI